MSRVRVEQDRRGYAGPQDWEMRCEEHGEHITTYSWLSAMEAAYGHLVMHHDVLPPERPVSLPYPLPEPTDFGAAALDDEGDLWFRTNEALEGEYSHGFPWCCEHSIMKWENYGQHIVQVWSGSEVKRLLEES